MAYKVLNATKNVQKIYVWPVNNPKDQRLGFLINKSKKQIIYYPQFSSLKRIYIEGFTSLPHEFSPKGYIKHGLKYYLNKMLTDKNVSKLFISKDKDNKFKNVNGSYVVTINYNDFRSLTKKVGQINRDRERERSKFVDEFFHNLFPKQYPKVEISSKLRASRVMHNLDENIIEHLDKNDVNKLLDFFESLVSTKYSSALRKRRLLSSAKIKVDDVAISGIIQEFEQMLSQNHNEAKWANFLKRNLFLIDSKYVNAIPQLNVVLAGSRKVDFGLIDSQGYLDIFEIKKPSTKLLASKPDRGNYYWSTEAVKALVQAEKYLFNAERKAPGLTEDIKKEKGLQVEVVKPRAVVIVGKGRQLDNSKKTNDFRVLRQSLKNIEVVLYDELLQRIKNQKNKIYVE